MPVIGSLPIAATSSGASSASSSETRKGSPPPAHVQHAVAVQIEAGLEAVVGAEDLQRQPRGHDLGDRGRNEGLVGVLGDELVALGVHHEHQPRRSERRDLLLDAGQGGSGQQEQGEGEGEGEGEQARPHGDSSLLGDFAY